MGTIHASARESNVRARVFAHLNAQSYAGVVSVIFEGDEHFAPQTHTPFIRFSIVPIGETWSGRFSATAEAYEARVMLVGDVFAPDGSEDGTHDAFAVDRAADDVAHVMRELSLSMKDYASTPATPTAVADSPIRVVEGALQRIPLPNADGYRRRQITNELRWHFQHSD